MEPRARVSVWPGRRRVPGIVAPDSWGARGAECLPRDVLRRSSPATSPCDGTTGADVCAMERVRHHGSTPPRKQCTPGASWGSGGIIAPSGQFRAGFSEQDQPNKERSQPRTGEVAQAQDLVAGRRARSVEGHGITCAGLMA